MALRQNRRHASSHTRSDIRTGRAFAARGLRSLGFGLVIAARLTLAFGLPFDATLVQPVCTGAFCCFGIDGARRVTARRASRLVLSLIPGIGVTCWAESHETGVDDVRRWAAQWPRCRPRRLVRTDAAAMLVVVG